ncbi:MAG: hypothetical protein ACTS3F_14740, partial [Phycisphaerales bacterium]
MTSRVDESLNPTHAAPVETPALSLFKHQSPSRFQHNNAHPPPARGTKYHLLLCCSAALLLCCSAALLLC